MITAALPGARRWGWSHDVVKVLNTTYVYTLKVVKKVNFMLCLFYDNKKQMGMVTGCSLNRRVKEASQMRGEASLRAAAGGFEPRGYRESRKARGWL